MKKTLKRTLALILTVVMIISVAAVMPVAAETQGATAVTQSYTYKDDNKNVVLYGTEEYEVIDDTITVDNSTTYKLVDDETEFLAIVSGLTANYLLMDDIDFTTTFSNYVINGKFQGEIEGNGKALNNIEISIPAGSTSAIFSQLIGTAKVKNMVVNIKFTGSKSLTGDRNYAGVVAGIPNSTDDVLIDNLKVNIDVDITDTNATNNRVLTMSGIAGFVIGKITISNCTVDGNIKVTTASKYAYGCGIIYGTKSGTNYKGEIIISNCENYADIQVVCNNSTKNTCVAGIMGIMQDFGDVTIENTTNYGDLTGDYRTSGIIGFARRAKSISNPGGIYDYLSIINCENKGILSGTIQSNLVDYMLTNASTGVVGIASVGELTTAAADSGKYYVLTADIDLGNAYDANTILADFADSKLDFCGYKITGSSKIYTHADTATNILQPIVTIDTTYVGYQTTKLTDGAYTVRLLAVVDDYTLYDEIGFDVTINGTTHSFNCYNVYSSVSGNYGTSTYSATQLGGKYIVALRLTGVTGDISNAEITPWVKYKGATDKSSGAKQTVTVTASSDAQNDVSGRQ
ncbi:MAG: hypothetical protein IJZ83_07940 [Clostridia bacterium]|nr:hypothetical protein [Clostridia bacterium]